MSRIATNSLKPSTSTGFVYGQALAVQSLNALIQEIAETDLPILLVGESGTGKEIYARLIHRLSGLCEAPLNKVNCAALDAGRLLAELREELLSSGGNGEAAPRTVFSNQRRDFAIAAAARAKGRHPVATGIFFPEAFK